MNNLDAIQLPRIIIITGTILIPNEIRRNQQNVNYLYRIVNSIVLFSFQRSELMKLGGFKSVRLRREDGSNRRRISIMPYELINDAVFYFSRAFFFIFPVKVQRRRFSNKKSTVHRLPNPTVLIICHIH